jgi:2-polyprenyl-3-methyl-5-hydroxy-6-metoxy-1,4-benzoquinol methylase
MTGFIKIPASTLTCLTNVHHERNIYAHPNSIARNIFWQRLETGFGLLNNVSAKSKVLDLGGGSGAFLPSLAQRFAEVSVVDLDLDDARRVKDHYSLKNVRLFEQDISSWDNDEIYDLVIAMDVLEHFADKTVPHRFLGRHLKPDSLLLVSLPTENWLYQLGRSIIGKTKPADHYHAAHELVQYYQDTGYSRISRLYAPRLGPFALPLFYIALFRKNG